MDSETLAKFDKRLMALHCMDKNKEFKRRRSLVSVVGNSSGVRSRC